jgi:hypothetical protein
MRSASRRVSPGADGGLMEWMDIRLPASWYQTLTNCRDAIDCTIEEELFFLQDAVHENACCGAQRA